MTDASEAIEAVEGVIFDWVFVICEVEGSATDGLCIVETVKEGLDAIYMLIIRSLALEDDMIMEVSARLAGLASPGDPEPQRSKQIQTE